MPFPFTDLTNSKRRPVLLLRRLDQKHDDWLVCMISSQIHQYHENLDWVLDDKDPEFERTGLKVTSVIRLSRLAVLDGSLLLGKIGSIHHERLVALKYRLSDWLIADSGGLRSR